MSNLTAEEKDLFLSRAKAYVSDERDRRRNFYERDKADWQHALAELKEHPSPDTVILLDVAERLKQRNKGGFWAKFTKTNHLMGWLNHEGKCVYCGVDLVEEGYNRHGWATSDHLVPKSLCPALNDCYLNMVPACSGCNGLKRHFDPRAGGEGKGYAVTDFKDLSNLANSRS